MIKSNNYQTTEELANAHRALIRARENHQYIESKVACIELQLLLDGKYCDEEGEPVKEREGIEALSEWEFERFYKDRHLEILKVREEGFAVEEGYCPALIAKNQLRKAENAFVDAGEFIAGVTSDELNARIKFRREYIETLEKLIQIKPL